jgi:outer membrane biosynthesis protein TonB
MAIDRSWRHYENRYRRILRWALVVSLFFHIAVLLWFRADLLIPESPFAAAGPRAGDAAAAAGGGTQLVQIRVTQPQIEPEPSDPVIVPAIPVPVPEPEPVVEELKPKPEVVAISTGAAIAMANTAGVGENRGNMTGTGIEGGTGRGDGGNAEEGLFRLVPPSPRGLILPPSDRPGKLRGKEVDVWVFVTARGQVVADSTRVDPSTGDGKFDDRLRKQAAEWVFEPARKAGQPVAEWFRYTIIL